MEKNKSLLAVAALVLTVGMAGWIYALVGFTDLGNLDGGSAAWAPEKSADVDEETNVDSVAGDDSGAAGGTSMRIATVPHATLADASKVLSFTPRTPSKTFLDATLTGIETAGNEEDTNVDSLYLTFSKGDDVVFKMFEGKSTGFYGAGQNVTIDGVTGVYYMVEGWVEDTNPDAIAYDGGLAPRSYIYWTKNGISYEISEFGDLSKEQLVELGNSLK